jgi:phage/plasmid-like protein (TIGR03299 family)
MTKLDTFASSRDVPWHTMGTSVDGVMNAQQAIEAGGLDWNVYLDNAYRLVDGTPEQVSGRYWVTRDADNKILGHVAERYKPFQNREAFQFIDNLIDSGEANFDSVGSYRGGRVVFLTARLPQEILVGGEDPHDLYLLMRTSHDASHAVGVYLTPVRRYCTNVLTLAVHGARYRWTVRHTSTMNGKLAEARDTLQLSVKYAEEFASLGDKLMHIKVNDDKARKVFEQVIPQRPKTEETLDDMMKVLETSTTNGYRGTAWGAINALTEYYEHYREHTQREAQFINTTEGIIHRYRNAATQRLLALQ